MNQVKYQVTLSIDGNHSVAVTGDDQEAVNQGLAWARGIYLKLQERAQGSGSPGASQAVAGVHHELPRPAHTPICANHHLPMVSVSGQRGPFWSCHERTDDGRFCSYRPPQA